MKENGIEDASRLAAGIFAIMGWYWDHVAGSGIPDHEQIAARFRELIAAADKDATYSTSSGRLTVQWDDLSDTWRLSITLGSVAP